MMAPHFPLPNAATQQQLGINVTTHLQDGGSKSVYVCVLVGGANNGLGAVVAIEVTIQAAEPEAVESAYGVRCYTTSRISTTSSDIPLLSTLNAIITTHALRQSASCSSKHGNTCAQHVSPKS